MGLSEWFLVIFSGTEDGKDSVEVAVAVTGPKYEGELEEQDALLVV